MYKKTHRIGEFDVSHGIIFRWKEQIRDLASRFEVLLERMATWDCTTATF